MASAVSLEYLQSIEGTPNGVATLNSSGQIPENQLPATANTYLGVYATPEDLETAYPTATTGNYAYVTSTGDYWYWNAALTTPAWVEQEISVTAYQALTATEQAGVPYIIEPASFAG